MLKKFTQTMGVLVLSTVTALPLVAHAKDANTNTTNTTTTSEVDSKIEFCTANAYIAAGAMHLRQTGASKQEALNTLNTELVNNVPAEEKELVGTIVNQALATAYEIEVFEKNEEKEEVVNDFASGVFSGCAEALGVKPSDLK